MWSSIKKTLRTMIGTIEDMEEDFKNLEKDLKEVADKAEANSETKVVEETRHVDGSITVKTTTVRKLVVKK